MNKKRKKHFKKENKGQRIIIKETQIGKVEERIGGLDLRQSRDNFDDVANDFGVAHFRVDLDNYIEFQHKQIDK